MIEIQYLESTENLKKNILANQRWTPTSGQAEAIAACLRQGRLFFEAAKRAPLEIRPLELYYGTSAYAKALVLATDRNRRIDNLQQAHGVSDKSSHNARLEQLSIVINERGTFQEFNDSIRTLNCIRPIAVDGSHPEFTFPTADSASVAGLKLSLKDIFGRLPGLEALYRATFDERENIDYVQINGPEEGFGWCVSVRSTPWNGSFGNFVTSLEDARSRMPFLRRWSFQEASALSGGSLMFRNAKPLANELDPNEIQTHTWGFTGQHPAFSRYFRDIESSLGNLIAASRMTGGGYYMQPINGQYIAFQSLQFLALHLLSSLVRYRPAIWMHALSRSASNGRVADDAMLALIEAFMERVLVTIPIFVADVIRPGLAN
ncbi:YaaC family protein [Burkholderia ubonensis]|uniref:YaaC family protein n=1 Tax=Burkholderia ubonensis TaxID=101571 RepID=UPI0009B4825E|nr:YaaC family protein [Burkholderia ubonensis]